jgi:hypothetical protein
MEKEFIPYEQALALKELGFDEPCMAAYFNQTKEITLSWYPKCIVVTREENYVCRNSSRLMCKCTAPSYSQAFRWFREKYDWQHSIDPTADQHSHKLGYNYWIWNYKTGEEHYTMPKNRPTGDWEYETYEEAELECLKKLIEIVKQ